SGKWQVAKAQLDLLALQQGQTVRLRHQRVRMVDETPALDEQAPAHHVHLPRVRGMISAHHCAPARWLHSLSFRFHPLTRRPPKTYCRIHPAKKKAQAMKRATAGRMGMALVAWLG